MNQLVLNINMFFSYICTSFPDHRHFFKNLNFSHCLFVNRGIEEVTQVFADGLNLGVALSLPSGLPLEPFATCEEAPSIRERRETKVLFVENRGFLRISCSATPGKK